MSSDNGTTVVGEKRKADEIADGNVTVQLSELADVSNKAGEKNMRVQRETHTRTCVGWGEMIVHNTPSLCGGNAWVPR